FPAHSPRTAQLDSELLQAVPLGIGDTADRAQQLVERDADLLPAALAQKQLLAALPEHAHRLMIGAEIDALLAELARDHFGDLRVFPGQDARKHLDLRHARSEPREALGE